MKRKNLINQLLAITLCIVMMFSLMPMSVYALSTSVLGAEGHILDAMYTGEFTSGLDSTIIVYTTPNVSDYMQYEIMEQGGFFAVPSYDKTQWYFAGWKTWYVGSLLGLGVTKSNKANPVYDDNEYYFNISTNGFWIDDVEYPAGSISVLKEEDWKGTYYLSAIFEPLVTINAGNGVSYNVSGASKRADNTYSTKYSNGMTIECTVEDAYYISSVSASYGTQYSVSGSVVSLSSITRPTSININTHLKQQKVIFDANGGEGTMAAQTFEHSVAQGLTANIFTRTGYTFAGWNTKADGTGTGYADKESVSFTPANDGDSITLYAQWTQCNDHNWEDGECTKCGALCSHSGGDATCTEQAICDICGEKYGSLAKHSVVYDSADNKVVETCTVGCGHTATAELVLDTNASTVYTGSAIEALKVVYSDNWQGGNLDIAYSNNVNAGTASGSVSIGVVVATQTFAITAATMTDVSAQGYSGTYDGQPHGITVNAPEGATVSYKVGNGEFITENPTFKDAGSYTVAYKVSMANHTDVEGTAEVNIDKASLTVTANNHSIKYGEAPANNGVTYSGFISEETKDVLSGTLAYDYTYAADNDIGSYEITPKGLTSNNYEITFVKGTLTVDKADATCTPPTANNPTYTGRMQELVTAGTVDGGTMVFSFDEKGGYFETLSAKEAGNYTVWYKVIGDDNHNSSIPASIKVEIKKATPDLGTVSVSGTVYDTTATKDVVLVCTNTEVPGKLSIEKAGDYMRADRTEYFWEFVPEDTDNYEAVYGYIDIDVVDTVAPTASISVNEDQWTFWDTVTFGLFYNEGKEVTITYADNENGSGLKDMLYYVADKGMSADELKDVQWTAYSEAFDLDPDGKYVVYAKAVDNDGNTVTVNSNGYVLDKTQAVVEGLTNGGIYYGQLVFTVADELAGVKSVVIDGTDETHFEGQYVIDGDNAEHTVTVTDNAGNMTEYKVTVYKNYTVTYKAGGETVSTQTVGHGKDATLPAVPAKNGYTGKWDHDGKNITSDMIINAVYTENSAPVPSDPQSPQTGDNSNMVLWIILLFVSGGAVITLTVIERKKRTVNR